VRKKDGCVNCGEVREIAAHGRCFKCYRRKDREADREFAYVDRHNPGVRREHTRVLRGFTSVLSGLGELGVSQNEVMVIRRMLEPYLALVSKFLVPEVAPDARATAVNSEHNLGTFTVHPDEEKAAQRDSHEEDDRP
jgi:hypothetical protein